MRARQLALLVACEALAGCVHSSVGASMPSAAVPSAGFAIVGDAEPFAPGVASTEYSDARLTISPDGRTALWFSRDRPGGAGGYDIWMSRRDARGWGAAVPVPFNSGTRDFDPAFTADGRFVYFSSDRPGGLGGDDIWRVAVTGPGRFAGPEHLGAAVNSAGNEWAPMLSPDGGTLLFSSNGRDGPGRMDLFAAQLRGSVRAHGVSEEFAAAMPLPGDINTGEDEFDATFLADGHTVVFTRAPDIRVDDVELFRAGLRPGGGYEHGQPLPPQVNTPDSDTYAPMLDWSQRHSLAFTTRRPAKSARGMDLYVVKYRP